MNILSNRNENKTQFENVDSNFGRLFFIFIKILFYLFSLSISAKIKFYLPFSQVPFTFQMLIIFFIIFSESRKIAFLSIFSYLLSGLLSFPVFSSTVGIQALLSPTGGYILGFLFSSFLANESEFKIQATKWNNKELNQNILVNLTIKGLSAIFIVYLFGFLGLLRFTNPKIAFITGILPFILFDIYKLIICLFLFSKLYSKKEIKG